MEKRPIYIVKPIYRLVQDLRREEASHTQEMGRKEMDRKPDFNANRWIQSPFPPTREYHRTHWIVRRVQKIPLQRLSFTLSDVHVPNDLSEELLNHGE